LGRSLESDVWDAFADISRDQGLTWTASSLVPVLHEGHDAQAAAPDEDSGRKLETILGRGLIQPTIWESQPGHLHMLLRSTSGSIYRSDSADSGQSWSPAYRTYLPNNNSGIDLAKLDNGTLVLAYNPVGMYKGPRMPLLLSYSEDNGANWRQLKVLEGEYISFSLPPPEFGEYSYPAVIAQGRNIYVTYTWKRINIVYWSLEVEF
jgi:predicted neuraminidase